MGIDESRLLHRNRSCKAERRKGFRNLLCENLERREVMAGSVLDTDFRLLSVAPNTGEILSSTRANNLTESPRELIFRFTGGDDVRGTTLRNGIRIARSGGDGVFGPGGTTDVLVNPDYLDFADSTNNRVVVARFSQPLPDDLYRVEILGVGQANAVRNVANEPLIPRRAGTDRDTYTFNLELGTKIDAIVPQPMRRAASGALSQDLNVIEVYFNDSELYNQPIKTGDVTPNPSVVDPRFYNLIATRDSMTPFDDVVVTPTEVAFDPVAKRSTLTFAAPIHTFGGFGTFRLRIGSELSSPAYSTLTPIPLVADPQGFRNGAFDINVQLNAGAPISSTFTTILEQEIHTVSDFLLMDFPGSSQEPGHRDIQEDRSLRSPDVIWGQPNFAPDGSPEIRTIRYNFMENQAYGVDSNGRRLFTSISPEQKQRVREIFEFYSRYLGVDFKEYSGPTAPGIFNIVVGDMIPIRNLISGPGDILGAAGQVPNPDAPLAPPWDMVILDGSEPWDNAFGFGVSQKPLGAETVPDQPVSAQQGPFSFFNTAMHEIGHLLGFDHTFDLPAGTIMGSDNNGGTTNTSGGIVGTRLNSPANPLEQIFPGTIDQIHGQHLFRPDNRDVDLYRFEIAPNTNGQMRLETIAERLNDSSTLDTHITLLKRDSVTGELSIVAANNNYFSQDSFIDVPLTSGEYFVAVTGKGNEDNNPLVRDTGSGATSQGRYQLRFEFKATNASNIVEQTSTSSATGPALDGDGDGIAGGDFNFWFRAVGGYGTTSASPRTLVVDKAYTGLVSNGTLTQPFKNISEAISAAQPGDIVRLAGVVQSLTDPLSVRAYEIGVGAFGVPLSDGDRLEIPKDVILMIDAGVTLKMGNSRILVGSDGVIDRSKAAIQVLGTPTLPVYFTSYTDQSRGIDTNPLVTIPKPGDWGGIEIRNDVDRSQGRVDREREGIFLNTISNAVMTYGGGLIGTGSQAKVTSPIELAEARPLILGNVITLSADSAISADPNSFEETLFTEPRYQNFANFVPDYRRVGPIIYDNDIRSNTINGLFLRVETLPGQPLKTLTTHARFDDAEISYVFGENFVISGTPGGPLNEIAGPNTTLMILSPIAIPGTGFPAPATLEYLITYVDRFGQESLPSTSSLVSIAADESVRFQNIPAATDDYVSRKIYRRANPAFPYELVEVLNRDDTTFTDTNLRLPGSLQTLGLPELNRARQDGSLVIDPGMIAKFLGTRLEVGIGATLLAEGTESKPIIFTSRLDDRYGAAGTFDTNNDGSATSGAAGNWSGILARHMSELSIDYARLTFGGGESRIPGGFASFNAIEVHQATARIANSVIQSNRSGRTNTGGTNRDARGNNDSSAIFVLASQPVIINNIIRNNDDAGTAAISVDLSSLSSRPVRDFGRATGFNDRETTLGIGNYGPLVFNNRLGDNGLNGMRVRGGTLTTESVWDDTDIVHVLQSEVIVPDFHTYGGLRLVSKSDSSLVIKAGSNAGITAAGRPLDIKDRIGGSVQILGSPGFPVVITSLADDTIGAGFDDQGGSLVDTNNDLNASTPRPGDWRSVRFTPFSNDRNVDMTYERESDRIAGSGDNDLPPLAQDIGRLAGDLKLGDENLRLGITLTGSIGTPRDLDVYRFTGVAGSTVWLDIDQTSGSLDSMVELIDASGRIMALSDDSFEESTSNTLLNNPAYPTQIRAFPMDQLATERTNLLMAGTNVDFQATNPRDAGMRVILPGVAGTTNIYYARVRSSNKVPGVATDPFDTTGGVTIGAYKLHLRLQEKQEISGSTIRFADLRFATNGIEVFGNPMRSPLLGEFAEVANDASSQANSALDLGNVMVNDRAGVSVSGTLPLATDVDWFNFEVGRDEDSIQKLPATTSNTPIRVDAHQSVIFDLDYADGLGRPNTQLWVFRREPASGQLTLVLTGDDSNIQDDQAAILKGSDQTDLTRGSMGKRDAYIGPIELPPGQYTVAITNKSVSAVGLRQFTQSNIDGIPAALNLRLEPLDSVARLGEDRFESSPPRTTANGAPVVFSGGQVPYTLSDVTLFASRGTSMSFANAMTGVLEANMSRDGITTIPYTGGFTARDIAVSPAGSAMGFNFPVGLVTDANSGQFFGIDIGDTGLPVPSGVASGILTWATYPNPGNPPDVRQSQIGGNAVGDGMAFTALTYASIPALDAGRAIFFGVGSRLGNGVATLPSFNEPPLVSPRAKNILFQLNPDTGAAINWLGQPTRSETGYEDGTFNMSTTAGTNIQEAGYFTIGATGAQGAVTGVTTIGTSIFGVTDRGELVTPAVRFLGPAAPAVVRTILDPVAGTPINFTGLTRGPANVEGGRFANMLFGVSTTGLLYAFNTTGVLQPVFPFGATSVQLAFNPVGIDFSSLDANLWHISSTDPESTQATGHGRAQTFNRSGDSQNSGNRTIRFAVPNDLQNTNVFGTDNFSQLQNTYAMPGGTRGAFESALLDLSSYSADDQPVMYFNYNLLTQNSADNNDGNIFGDGSQTSFMDSFRVYGAGEDGQWILLTTNNSAGFQDTSYADGMMFPPFSEYDVPRNGNQDAFGRSYISSTAFDNRGWRQARVSLGALAGKRDVKIRFEFHSGGDFYTNDPTRGGIELSAVSGVRIADRDLVDISRGVDTFRLEFDLGLVLNVPSGRSFTDGVSQLVIGANTYTFTFSPIPGPGLIPFTPNQSPATVAATIANVLSADGYTVRINPGTPNVLNVTYFQGDRLPDPILPTDYQIVGADPDIIAGLPGVGVRNIGGVDVPNIPIIIDQSMPAVPQAQPVFTILGDQYAGGVLSFADEASATLYDPNAAGGPAPIAALQVPSAALGEPDYEGGTAEPVGGDGVVSLGRGGVLVVQFTDNFLTGNNITGPLPAARDLAIYEVGDAEDVRVEVSADGINWTGVGIVSGANRYIDLDQFGFNSESLLQFVRLTDVATQGSTTGDSVGADIDAVGALSSRQRSVRDSTRVALAQGMNVAAQQNNVEVWRYFRDTIRVYGAGLTVVDSGPLRLSGGRVGDSFGPRDTSFQFTQAALRTLNNGTAAGTRDFPRSVTIDDIVISFAERGEIVSGAAGFSGTQFADTFQYELFGGPNGAPAQEIETGSYQLELRTAPDYGKTEGQNLAIEPVPLVGPKGRTYDTNDRLVKGIALDAEGLSSQIGDGYTFTLSNGVNLVTFEFNVFTSGGGDPAFRPIIPGRFRIPLSPSATDGEIALAIRNAVNDNAVRALLGVTAQINGDMFGTPLFNDSLGTTIQFNGNIASDLFGEADFTLFDPSGAPSTASLTVIRYGQDTQWGEDIGDGNILREQGQMIISGATVLNSSQYGINLRTAPRDLSNRFINMDVIPTGGTNNPKPISTESIDRPYPGSVRNMITLNNSRIASGPVIVNNILAKNGSGGIFVGGDTVGAGTGQPDAPVTVARIVNNTIYGGGSSSNQTGIEVESNTSPTILSNILANLQRGINVANDASLLGSIVIGANLYQGNSSNVLPAPLNGSQSFPIFLGATDPLFTAPTRDQYYLRALSQAIDSSIASLEDRNLLDQVRSAVGLPTSPIIAPEFDAYGLLRSDDPNVSTPGGLGSNVFADRGAVDRVDLNGPLAVLQRPLDNDSAGNDSDPFNTYIRLRSGQFDYFEVLIDERQGTGPDPLTINQDNVVLTENGRILLPGIDYVFGYSFNSRNIRLTPLAGFWRQDSVYELTLINKPTLRVVAPSDAADRSDGQTLTVNLIGGGSRTLELDSGYTLTVPTAGVTDGQFFTYTSGGQTTLFEFNLAGNTQTRLNSQVITFTTSDTRDTLATKIATALNPFVRQNGWPVQAIGGGRVAVGGNIGDLLDVSASSLTVSGTPGVGAGRTAVRFLPVASFDAIAMANQLTKALNQVGSGVKAYTLANGLVFVEGVNSISDVTSLSLIPITDLAGNLLQANRANSLTQFTILMPEVSVDYGDAVQRTGTGSTSSTLMVNDGVRHAIYPDDASRLVLGAFADADDDGVPSVAADADDNDSGLNLNTLSPFISISRNGPARLVTAAVSPSTVGKTLTIEDEIGNVVTYQFVDLLNPLTNPSFLPVDVTGLVSATDVATALRTSILSSILAGRITGIYAQSTGSVVSLGGTRNHLFDLSGAGSEIMRAMTGTLGLTVNSSLVGLSAGQTLLITDGSGNTVGFEVVNTAAPTAVLAGNYPVSVNLTSVTPNLLASALASAINSSILDLRLRMPTVTATGATLVVQGDDEDGFSYSKWFNKDALPTPVTLTASANGMVDAWIDWNQDNDFNDAGEQILTGEPVVAGTNTFYVATPASAAIGFTTARFRLSSTGNLFTYGLGIGGEVEDHLIEVLAGSPPIGVDDPSYTVAEDNTLTVAAPGVLGNDSDPDDVIPPLFDTLQVYDSNRRVPGIQPVREPEFGYLTLNANGSFVYVPKQDFFGTDIFIYDVSDNRMTGNRSVTVTITVTPVNDAPVAVDDTVSILEDATQTWPGALFTSNDRRQPDRAPGTDGDQFDNNESGQILTVVSAELIDRFGVVRGALPGESLPPVAGNQIVYTPAKDYNNLIDGPLFIRLLIQDSGVAGGDANPKNPGADELPPVLRYSTLTINIADVNDRPEFTIPNVTETPLEDATVTRTGFLANISPSERFVPINNYPALDELGPTPATPSLVRQAIQFLVNEIKARPTDPSRFAVDGSGNPLLAISPTGTLTYTLARDVNILNAGPIVVEVIAQDNGAAPGSRRLDPLDPMSPVRPDLNQSAPQRFTILVTEVNDPPQFVIPTANQLLSISEDEEVSPVPGFITNILAGPPTAGDENGGVPGLTGQSVSFVVLPRDPSRFTSISITPFIPGTSVGGSLSYDLAPDVNRLNSGGDIIVDVFAVDSGSSTAPNINQSPTQSFTIRVAEINDAPQFTVPNRLVTVDEDNEQVTGLNPTVIPGFATGVRPGPLTAVDEVGQMLTFNILSSSNPNLFSVQPTIIRDTIDPSRANLSFVTAADQNGTSVLIVRLNDNGVGSPLPNSNTSTLVTFTITVRAVNDAPQFTIPNTVVSDEDQGTVTLSNFATDIRPGPETAFDELRQELEFLVTANDPSLFDGPTGLPSISVDGTLTYRTAVDLNSKPNSLLGRDARVVVRLRDDGLSGPSPNTNISAPRTFTISINPINDQPVPRPNYQIPINEDVRTRVEAADVLTGAIPGPPDEVNDPQTLTITNIESTTDNGGTVLPVYNGGGTTILRFDYIPPLNFVGQDVVRYIITDNGTYSPGRRSATGTVTFNISPINDPPEFTSGGNVTVNEDSVPYSATWATNIAAGPPSAIDEISGPTAQTVGFVVTTENDSMFSATGRPAVNSAGVLSFTLAKDVNGQVRVFVTAVDSGSSTPPNNNRSNTSTFTITINPVNDEPDFNINRSSIVVTEDSGAVTEPNVLNRIVPAIGNNATPATALDEATQSITITTTNDRPSLFSVQPTVSSTGVLTFTPALNQFGSAVVQVFATDNGSNVLPNRNTSATKSFTITIVPDNDSPFAVDDRYTTSETTVLSRSAPGLLENDIDPEGDPLVISTAQTVSQFGAQVAVNANGSFTYNPTNPAISPQIKALVDGQTLTDTFTYRARDTGPGGTPKPDSKESNLATVTVTVTGFNDAPVTVNDPFGVPVNTTRLLNVLDNDFDVDTPINVSSIEIGVLPINGTATPLADGRIRYTPSTNFRGTDVFSYRVRDSLGKFSNEATVTVRVNTAPIANPDAKTVKKNVATLIDVLSNDSDPDGTLNPATIQIVTTPLNGTANVVNGQVEFTPRTGFEGTTTFQYVVSDNDGLPSNTSTVTVRVVSSFYQNPTNRFDVDDDTFVSPIDALIIINLINSKGPGWDGSTVGLPGPPDYVDIDGDDRVGPLDVLSLINFLNSGGVSGEGEGGEGEGGSNAEVSVDPNSLNWNFDVLGLNIASDPIRSSYDLDRSLSAPANAAQPFGGLRRSFSSLSLADYLVSLTSEEEENEIEGVLATDATTRTRDAIEDAFADLFGD